MITHVAPLARVQTQRSLPPHGIATSSSQRDERRLPGVALHPWLTDIHKHLFSLSYPSGVGDPPSLQVLRIKLNPMPPQKFLELSEGIEPLMVLFLLPDIPRDVIQRRFADRESSVALLPGKVAELRERLVDPFRRSLLHVSPACRHDTNPMGTRKAHAHGPPFR